MVHIADIAGGHWPQTIRAALVAAFNLAEAAPQLQILSDLRVIFRDKKGPEYLATSDLLSHLRLLENRPWSSWTNKSGRILARYLRAFGIMSRRFHIDPENDFMGYLFQDFQDAWERYLPPLSAGVETEPIKVAPAANAAQPKTAISAVGAA